MRRWLAMFRRPVALYRHAVDQYRKARDLGVRLSLDMETAAEVYQQTVAALRDIDERIAVVESILADQLDEALKLKPELADPALARLGQGSLADLTAGAAELLTHEYGPRGFRAEAGLWVNSPLWVGYGPQSAYLVAVNERVVEIPFIFREVAHLPSGARIVDVGACESTVALSLASLGFAVTALDVRPYPFAHPNLTTVEDDILNWVPAEPFDAAVCVSTIEHLGVGWYGDPKAGEDADIDALAKVRSWLKPGGELLLTIPYGAAQAGEHQRSYDAERLAKLLAGWDVATTVICERNADGHWVASHAERETGHGVALVRATRPA